MSFRPANLFPQYRQAVNPAYIPPELQTQPQPMTPRSQGIAPLPSAPKLAQPIRIDDKAYADVESAYGQKPGTIARMLRNAYYSSPGYRLAQQQDAANAANEQRYQQLLGDNQATENRALDVLDSVYGGLMGFSNSGRAAATQRNDRALKDRLGAAKQSAQSRGLMNTTILDSMERGERDDAALRQLSIDDQYNRMEVGLQQDYARGAMGTIGDYYGARSGIMERRTDAQPNLGLYAQMLSQPTGSMGGVRRGGSFGGYYSRPYGSVKNGEIPQGGATPTIGAGYAGTRPTPQPAAPAPMSPTGVPMTSYADFMMGRFAQNPRNWMW
jgi:hypothetical protein